MFRRVRQDADRGILRPPSPLPFFTGDRWTPLRGPEWRSAKRRVCRRRAPGQLQRRPTARARRRPQGSVGPARRGDRSAASRLGHSGRPARAAALDLRSDTGPRVQGRHIDIYMWSCYEALGLGRRPVQIEVLRLGWNPRASTPRLIDRLFKAREQAQEAPPPPPPPPPPDQNPK